jgi:hypothetical protein
LSQLTTRFATGVAARWPLPAGSSITILCHMIVTPGCLLFWRMSLALAGLLATATARAQVPALLLGQWEMRQISFVASQTVPPDIMERMDNPEVAELNQEVAAGAAHLLVAFRPDGTYQFSVRRAGEPDRLETGTYAVRAHVLLAESPTTEGGSSFNQQHLIELSRRKLVVEFPVGNELPGVLEEIEYRRVR